MNIVFFVHAGFLDSQSMPRFARMLEDGMLSRGHSVDTWSPRPVFFRLPLPKTLKKWMGYIDQYIVFPREVKQRLKRVDKNTIFVFTDNALGPWVPLIAHLPHAIHCHDFLAQRSAMGDIAENKTGWTGRQYQRFIRKGYSKGKNFISVSHKTSDDLHKFLNEIPPRSEMVYNGLNQSFVQKDPMQCRRQLTQLFGIGLEAGFILHVGGNQWYKNRLGVIEIYNAWRQLSKHELPLLLIGEQASEEILSAFEQSPFKIDIHLLAGVADENVRSAYSAATVFLFPSLAEGFGWPIAESMAAGCPVITTNESPMTEVAGNAGFQIDRRPSSQNEVADWATKSAKVVEEVVSLSASERDQAIEKGLLNVKRFESSTALNEIEKIYSGIIADYQNSQS